MIQMMLRILGILIAFLSIVPSLYFIGFFVDRVNKKDGQTNYLIDMVMLVVFVGIMFSSMVYITSALGLVLNGHVFFENTVVLSFAGFVNQVLKLIVAWGLYFVSKTLHKD